MLKSIKPWVVYWEDLKKVYSYAKANNFAVPAINVVGSDSINAALQAAKEVNYPIVIQFSQWWAKFLWNNDSVLGAVIWAKHIHELAEAMWVIVILHTDHANKKALPWIDY